MSGDEKTRDPRRMHRGCRRIDRVLVAFFGLFAFTSIFMSGRWRELS